jgi:hypothetical protein
MADKPIKKRKNELIKEMPFNFCDHWCTRCDLSNQCPAWQQRFNQRLNHIIKGEDPDHPEIAFSDLRENVHYLVKSIKENMDKEKISLSELKIKLVQVGFTTEPEPQHFPLWKKGFQFQNETETLLQDIFSQNEENEIPEEFLKVKKRIEELNWYQHFFLKKLYQALVLQKLFCQEKNKQLKTRQKGEMNVAAKLAWQSLNSCQQALEKMSFYCSGYGSWTKDLSVLAKLILEQIETKFPDYQKQRTIFHGN